MGKSKNRYGGLPIHKPKTQSEFYKMNNELNRRGFYAIDALKPGAVRTLSLGDKDPSSTEASDMALTMGNGAWSSGPLSKVAWNFDERNTPVQQVNGKDGKPLGLGYVYWGPGNNTPSVIPPLAMALPYTAAPLRYIADLTAGLGPRLMYRFPDGDLVEYKYAGEILRDRVEELEAGDDGVQTILPDGILGSNNKGQQSALKRARQALDDWNCVWYGYDVPDDPDEEDEKKRTYTHIPGAKEFLEENNLDLHLSQCEQDDVMLDIYFPTVGFSTKGRKGIWEPVVNRVGMLPAHSCRLEKMNENRFINHVYFSDSLRTVGTGTQSAPSDPANSKFDMKAACMPQRLLKDMRELVKQNQKTAANKRPMWVVCPTFYPSLNKPYYPQPAWWSVFSSKAFDFASTILYDKYKQRENNTTWGRIIYISLDYLEMIFADEGIEGDKEAQAKFVDDLDSRVEEFLEQRENTGKTMRQFMWLGQDGKDHHNVEIVDVAETVKDAVQAGKDELELATSPIFLALGIDPRLVGVPMVKTSNGGTAVRELHLLKQQQLSVKQRLYLNFLNTAVCAFNKWTDGNAEFHIVQQTMTTLDNSKTGTVETIAGEEA